MNETIVKTYAVCHELLIISEMQSHWQGDRALLDKVDRVCCQTVQKINDYFDATKYCFSKHQDLQIQTGSTMLKQFDAPGIGMANMYAMPVAVGRMDFSSKSPWRRFNQYTFIQVRLKEDSVVKSPRVSSGLVGLFACWRGKSRHILGQFGSNWSYLPKVFNLWFCNERNLEDLESGSNKLMYAENIMCTQKALLADVKFRARSAQSTLELIRKIGRTGIWAWAVNGDGIFMTVSAGERPNYLAIRLSNYRSADLHDTHASDKDEHVWIGPDRPSLEPFETHVFGVHVPGHNMRRKIQAKDPRCCSNAFFVQIRPVLATIAGIRMCQVCLLCAESDFPCQDALGSSSELVGGFAGRADVLYGAVEAQKTNGTPHFHFKLFVQHLHNARNDSAYCRRDANADC